MIIENFVMEVGLELELDGLVNSSTKEHFKRGSDGVAGNQKVYRENGSKGKSPGGR